MPAHRVPASLFGAVLLLVPLAANAAYYEATFTGTITFAWDPVDLEAWQLAGIAVGQTYTLVVRNQLTGTPVEPSVLGYPATSAPASTLHIDDGSIPGLSIATDPASSLSETRVGFDPAIGYVFSPSVGLAAGPSFSASVELLDRSAPYADTNSNLPLSLDLNQFSGAYPQERRFSIIVDPNNPAAVVGTVETFSARIVPTPGVAGLLGLAGFAALRRRRCDG